MNEPTIKVKVTITGNFKLHKSAFTEITSDRDALVSLVKAKEDLAPYLCNKEISHTELFFDFEISKYRNPSSYCFEALISFNIEIPVSMLDVDESILVGTTRISGPESLPYKANKLARKNCSFTMGKHGEYFYTKTTSSEIILNTGSS